MKMENVNQSATINIDVNSTDFYNKLQDEIESDLARVKKCVDVVINLRMLAAEMEVETAALYHAELFKNIEELKSIDDKFIEEFSKSDIN